MKPPPFEYLAPESLPEALAALKQHGSEAKLLAGGQSLVPAMNFRVAQPSMLIDINRISGLDGVRRESDGGLRLGALTRQRRLETDPEVREAAPLLAETVPFIAHPQIRNRGTLGGSLAHADPAAELPVIALALQARLHAVSADGDRWIEASDFFQGMFTTALAPEEMLTEVVFPGAANGYGYAFEEFARRRGDYALMGIATLLRLDGKGICRDARLVFLNAGEGPVLAAQAAGLLQGHPVTQENASDAARHAADKEIEPMGNLHATPAFQRHLARVLATRTILRAAGRARGDGPS
jgi:aerobic carbon-monoxide dehydrogenase medium subunit